MRKSKKIAPKSKRPLAFVVDGETEMWYLQMLKQNEKDISFKINPIIPQKKSIKEQYDLVCKLLGEEFDKVFWIIDLDTIIKETQTSLNTFKEYRSKLLLEKSNNVVVIVNNPCLEFWFLLHFKETATDFCKCSDAEKRLKTYLSKYEKTEKFFKKENHDIYSKLKPDLKTAIKNSRLLGNFNNDEPKKAICEMSLLFDSAQFKKIIK